MSSAAMAAVIAHSRATGPTYTVALMLAEHANADHRCWPSIGRLAVRSRVSRRTVFRAIEELERLGELQRESGGGRAPNHYVLMPAHVVDNEGMTGARVAPLRGGEVCQPGTAAVSESARQGCQSGTRTKDLTVRELRSSAKSSPPVPPEEVPARVEELRARLSHPTTRHLRPVDPPP